MSVQRNSFAWPCPAATEGMAGGVPLLSALLGTAFLHKPGGHFKPLQAQQQVFSSPAIGILNQTYTLWPVLPVMKPSTPWHGKQKTVEALVDLNVFLNLELHT